MLFITLNNVCYFPEIFLNNMLGYLVHIIMLFVYTYQQNKFSFWTNMDLF